MPVPPDLVLVLTDQQRHDQVGWHPGSVVRTPNLDRLATDGVVFDACYSGSTTCIPARTSLLTGRLDHRIPDGSRVLRVGTWTMAHALHDAGYQTAAIGKMHFTPMRADHGFDHLEVCEHFTAYPGGLEAQPELDHYHDWLTAEGYADWRLDPDGRERAPYPLPIDTHPTSWVRDRTLKLLADRDPSRPLFLVVSFPHPHPPINPPEAFDDLYDLDDVRVDLDGARLNDRLPSAFREAMAQVDAPWRRVDGAPLAVRRRELARTLGLITQIDDAIGDLVSALDLERTVMWFTSDHGDFGARRGLVRKVPWIPFDDLARVPCFATGGPLAGGRRRAGPMQSFDVVATFLELAGIDPGPGLAADGPLDSASQAGVLRDVTAAEDGKRLVCSAMSTGWPMVRRGQYKYIRSQGWRHEVLFDVVRDPDEHIDIADHPFGADVRAELSELLDAELRAGA